MKLNVLVYPMLSVNKINTDSNYVVIKQILNAINANSNDFNFFLLMDKNRTYVKDDLSPRVKLLNYPFPQAKRWQVIHFDTKLIKEIIDKYPIDIIWTNVPEISAQLKMFQDYATEKHDRHSVFALHHWVIHPSLGTGTYSSCRHIKDLQMLGLRYADANYFITKYAASMCIDEAKKYFSPTVFKQSKNKIKVIKGGFVEPGTISTKKRKHKKFSFIYNHRLAWYKGTDITFQMYDKLWEKRKDFQVVICVGASSDVGKYSKNRPYVIVKDFATHTEYLRELEKCHANVINSTYETYCVSIAESIAAGHVVIAPNRVTFPELLGEGYQYLFKNDEEQIGMMEDVLGDNIRSLDHGDIAHVYSHQYAMKFMQALKDSFQLKPALPRMKDQKKKEKIIKHLRKLKEITLKDMRSFLQKECKLSSQVYPPIRIKLLLNDLGFDFSLGKNTFIKRE